MGPIVNDPQRGFCYAVAVPDTEDGPRRDLCRSNGFETIPFAQLVPEITPLPSSVSQVDITSTTEPQKRLSKADKRAQRQQKKVNVARRKHLQRQKELHPEESSHVFNPFLTKANIKHIYNDMTAQCGKNNANSASSDCKLLQYHSIAIYKSDIDYMLPGEWLNDNNIALFYELITQTLALLQIRFANQVLLLYPTLVQLFLHFPASGAVEEMLPVEELKQLKYIFFPVNFIDDYHEVDLEQLNQGDHWALAVLSILESKIYIYDSMSLEEESDSDKKLLHQLTQRLMLCKNIIKTKKIEVVHMKCHQQDNLDDCGVYVLMITCYLISQLFFQEEGTAVDMDISKVIFNPLSARYAMIDLVHRLYVQSDSS